MKGLHLCFVDGPAVPDMTSDCPRRDEHTPAPTGYIQWHEWAAQQHRAGRRQQRCPGCDRLAVWTS